MVLTPDQEKVLRTVREFAGEKIAPRAAELDATGAFPTDILQAMGELDLMGIPIPRAYGGAGRDFLTYVLVLEEIARACATVAVILAVHTSVGTFPILNFGTDEQRRRFVPRLARGEIIGAFAITEPQAGSDAASIRTRAVRRGDHYVLNGSKVFITNAGYAGVYTVLAVTDPSLGSRGLTAFLVEPDTPGFRVGPPEKKMGLHASSTCQLFFEDCAVPETSVLGGEGQGFKIAMSLLDTGRIGIGAQALGLAEAALDASIAYARDHQQLGGNGGLQAVQMMLADMATSVEAARVLVYRAASFKDLGFAHGKEASMAKLFAADVAMRVTTLAVQLHGDGGYTGAYPVERYFREAKVTQIYEGTNQIQRLVIGRHLLRA